MEFKVGDKTITVTKRTVLRGAVTFTAGVGAYIIIRRIVKNNIPTEGLNIVGKTAVAVGAFFLANSVADEVADRAGKFFDDCAEAHENINKATQDVIDGLRSAKQA